MFLSWLGEGERKRQGNDILRHDGAQVVTRLVLAMPLKLLRDVNVYIIIIVIIVITINNHINLKITFVSIVVGDADIGQLMCHYLRQRRS